MLIDLYFGVDLFMNFRTAVFSPDGDLMHEPWEVAKLYLARWFVIDLVSTVPLPYVIYLPGMEPVPISDTLGSDAGTDAAAGAESSNERLLKLLRLFRLLKLMRLLRFKRILDRWEEDLYSVTVFSVAKLVLLVFAMGHWLSCGWSA